jgi:hypothetical protein
MIVSFLHVFFLLKELGLKAKWVLKVNTPIYILVLILIVDATTFKDVK